MKHTQRGSGRARPQLIFHVGNAAARPPPSLQQQGGFRPGSGPEGCCKERGELPSAGLQTHPALKEGLGEHTEPPPSTGSQPKGFRKDPAPAPSSTASARCGCSSQTCSQTSGRQPRAEPSLSTPSPVCPHEALKHLTSAGNGSYGGKSWQQLNICDGREEAPHLPIALRRGSH